MTYIYSSEFIMYICNIWYYDSNVCLISYLAIELWK